MTSPLAGKRIVLGVTGRHRRLQGGRGLPPARRRRRPRRAGHDRGRRALHRPHHAVGAGQRAGADQPVGRGHRPSRTPASARAPTWSSSRRPRPGCSPPTRLGLSTDLLTNVLLATRAPVVVCPAMHTEMWEHPARARQHRRAAQRGVHVVEPDESGAWPAATSAPDAWPTPDAIVAAVERVLGAGDLAGVARRRHRRRHPRADRRRASDRQPQQRQAGLRHRRRGAPPRCRTSRSSPRSTCPRQHGATVVQVETAAQMQAAMERAAQDADVVVMAAAVADFRPVVAGRRQDQEGRRRAPDRARADARHPRRPGAAQAAPGQMLVGFAAETADLRGQRRGQAAPQAPRPDRRQRRRRARRRLPARHQRRHAASAPTAADVDRRRSPTNARSHAAVLDSVSSRSVPGAAAVRHSTTSTSEHQTRSSPQ